MATTGKNSVGEKPAIQAFRARLLAALERRRVALREYGFAYNNIHMLELWRERYPDEAACLADMAPECSATELRTWGGVVFWFPSDDVQRKHGFDKLARLVEYLEKLGKEPGSDEPSDELVVVPGADGKPSTRRFAECSMEDLERAIRAVSREARTPPAVSPDAVPTSPMPGLPDETRSSIPGPRKGVNRVGGMIATGVGAVGKFVRRHWLAIAIASGLLPPLFSALRCVMPTQTWPGAVTRQRVRIRSEHREPGRAVVEPANHEEPSHAVVLAPEPAKPAPVEAKPAATPKASTVDQRPATSAPEPERAARPEPKPPKPAEAKPPKPAEKKEQSHKPVPSPAATHRPVERSPAAPSPTPEPSTLDHGPSTPFGVAAGAGGREHKPPADAPKEWYAKSRNRQFGPPYLSPMDIQRLCKAGQIDVDSKVWRLGSSEWRSLRGDRDLADVDCPPPATPRQLESSTSPAAESPEKLYEEASAERNENPKDAQAKLNQILRTAPTNSEIHDKATALLIRLKHVRER